MRFTFYFAVGTFCFSVAYYLLTPFSQGLISNTATPVKITPWSAIYFSIITASTLGYGDIIPQGASKTIACIEVVFGLTMMGIIVSKMASARLSYHVRRLFSSDSQRRLENHSTDFELVKKQFESLSPRIGSAFQETPKINTPDPLPIN